MATKTQLKTLTARIEALRAELASSYTQSLGPAAARCVAEDLATRTAELERVRGAR